MGCSWVLPEPDKFEPLIEEDAMVVDARPPRPDFAIATAFDMRRDMPRPQDMRPPLDRAVEDMAMPDMPAPDMRVEPDMQAPDMSIEPDMRPADSAIEPDMAVDMASMPPN
jgi:hypothetical protein